MNRHVSNATYGVLDYVAYPILMLAATPVLLHHLGVATFGLWLLANSAISAGSIVSSGFGDAVIQRIAVLRSSGSSDGVESVVANMLAINLVLSGVLSTVLFVSMRFITGRITHYDPTLESSCLWSLRIGAGLIVVKSVESVLISAQKAFECYGPAVKVSILARLAGVGLCIALAASGCSLPTIMAGTALVTCAGVAAQWRGLIRLGVCRIMPGFDRKVFRELTSFGLYSWVEAVAGMFFSQADKLILALTLGASAVSYYGVCVQITQPIHGLTAAGLHFIFPYLSGRHAAGSVPAVRGPILRLCACNLACSLLFTLAMSLFGTSVLERWMGVNFAARASGLVPLLALGFGFLSLNVTAHYAMLAMGKVSVVTALNVLGGVVMLVAMVLLIPNRGAAGAAWARLAYGPVTCLLYVPLIRILALRGTGLAPRRIVLTEGA